MNVLREIMAAAADIRCAEMSKGVGVSRSFLRAANNALKDLLDGVSDRDFEKAQDAAELIVEIMDSDPSSAEVMGFDRKAVDLMRKASKVFWRAHYRVEEAEDVMYEIEKVVRRLGVGR